jgi:hypothetical protein
VLSKDATSAFSRAAGIFILYLTSAANDYAHDGKRSTISSNDVIAALKEVEFDMFLPEIESFLEAYRREEERVKEKKRLEKAGGGNGAAVAAAASAPTDTAATNTAAAADAEAAADAPAATGAGEAMAVDNATTEASSEANSNGNTSGDNNESSGGAMEVENKEEMQ